MSTDHGRICRRCPRRTANRKGVCCACLDGRRAGRGPFSPPPTETLSHGLPLDALRDADAEKAERNRRIGLLAVGKDGRVRWGNLTPREAG